MRSLNFLNFFFENFFKMFLGNNVFFYIFVQNRPATYIHFNFLIEWEHTVMLCRKTVPLRLAFETWQIVKINTYTSQKVECATVHLGQKGFFQRNLLFDVGAQYTILEISKKMRFFLDLIDGFKMRCLKLIFLKIYKNLKKIGHFSKKMNYLRRYILKTS